MLYQRRRTKKWSEDLQLLLLYMFTQLYISFLLGLHISALAAIKIPFLTRQGALPEEEDHI